jgi:hypothetical protein
VEGAENCSIDNCFFDAVGGNGVFINNYNRGIKVIGNEFCEAGDSAVCMVGSDHLTADGIDMFPAGCMVLSEENVEELIRAGRCRWKIENENNNTLKTKGYQLEHNLAYAARGISYIMPTPGLCRVVGILARFYSTSRPPSIADAA